MTPTARSTQETTDFLELKTRLKATWMTGDYDTFSRPMEPGTQQFYRSLRVTPGTRLLDVACGAGQVALMAARDGARVAGCDIATNWIQKAKERAAREKLNVEFQEGDAEALPYADGSFDVVVSMVGAMFAPRPEQVASELTRVCRSGGTIAMANWTPGGFIGKMFKTIGGYIAPNGMPSPVLWGDENTVKERFSNDVAALEFERRMFPFEYPFSPEDVVEFFRMHYGPMTRAFASLNADAQGRLRTDLVNLWSAHNQGDATRTRVDGEYLKVVATRD